ncbi:MAG TPA: hypothetical protein VLE48_05870 [Terriglobales bacterium]|nr:hypothetical protein [Terriglobales bacterium]
MLVSLMLALPRLAVAGGPIAVGGPSFGVEGAPFTWSTTSAIPYRTDGGNLGALTNTQANNRVESMFNVWENVTTANIEYSRLGAIQGVADGDVSTLAEYNAVNGTCNANPPTQNPVIYDTNGSVFDALGIDTNVIGFAGPCLVNSAGRIISAKAVLNGKWIDGNPTQELSDSAFDGAIIHELGHFSGLDHSQINVNCLSACGTDDLIGLPTMFPVIFSTRDEDPGPAIVNPAATLATDDMAWISRLYPKTSGSPTFSGTYGTLTGIVRFSDGMTHAQGVNVIARPVDTGSNQDRKFAVSVVSGFKFTGNPGQSVTAAPYLNGASDNTGGDSFGSRQTGDIGRFEIPVPAGNYMVEVESIHCNPNDPTDCFSEGSSVGPLIDPIPMPGTAPAAAGPFAVTAGNTVNVGNIVLVGTDPRFDAFEGGKKRRAQTISE